MTRPLTEREYETMVRYLTRLMAKQNLTVPKLLYLDTLERRYRLYGMVPE